MTELVPQTQASAPEGAADLATILKRIANTKVASEPERPVGDVKVVPVPKGTVEAISRLNSVLKTVKLPSERRRLTKAEQTKLISLGSDAKLVEKTLKTAIQSVKTAFYNHLDVGLETDNDVDGLPVDPAGHYLVAGSMEVPGTGKKIVRQLNSGQAQITEAGLKSLYEKGQITREQYRNTTKHVDSPRVVDEDGLLEEIKRDPNLMAALAQIVEPGKTHSSFWIKDVDAED